jgi:hypothetical protein
MRSEAAGWSIARQRCDAILGGARVELEEEWRGESWGLVWGLPASESVPGRVRGEPRVGL